MRPKRKALGGGAVAFIDVMACGLGAVVLLLVVVDFRIDEFVPRVKELLQPPQLAAVPADSEERLELSLEQVKQTNQLLASSIGELTATVLEREISREALSVSLTEVPIQTEVPQVTNASGDLIGLSVNKSSIIILLDASASLFSESITDNVYYAVNPSEALAQQSRKWAQAQRIAKWIVDVAPDDATFKVAIFSETTKPVSQRWQNKQDVTADLLASLQAVIPQGGTNLEGAFSWVKRAARTDTQVFLITDGLPTKLPSQGRIRKFFSACSKDPRGYVSGECRQQIFAKSAASLSGTNVELNVILLPLEGDPKAAPEYWALAKSTSGLLFVPEEQWP